jgi:hypothetical protein
MLATDHALVITVYVYVVAAGLEAVLVANPVSITATARRGVAAVVTAATTAAGRVFATRGRNDLPVAA